jgi:hypothetical protein
VTLLDFAQALKKVLQELTGEAYNGHYWQSQVTVTLRIGG